MSLPIAQYLEDLLGSPIDFVATALSILLALVFSNFFSACLHFLYAWFSRRHRNRRTDLFVPPLLHSVAASADVLESL